MSPQHSPPCWHSCATSTVAPEPRWPWCEGALGTTGQSCHSPEVARQGELGCSARGEDAWVSCHSQIKIQLRVGQKGGEALEGEA